MTVNLPASGALGVITSTDPSANFIDQQLCIVTSNNPDLGQFFTDPGSGSRDLLVAALAGHPTFARSPAAAPSAVTSYHVNDLIPASFSLAGVATLVEGGAFYLPARAASGGCGLRAPVGFRYDVPHGGLGATSCVASAAASRLAAECSTTFSGDRLVNQLRLTVNPALSSGLTGVTVTRLQYVLADGTLGVYTTTPLAPGGTPVAAYNNVTGVCEYALKEVAYTLTYSSAGIISKVGPLPLPAPLLPMPPP